MTNILISEIFGPVIQGEGKYVGHPSIFIRTFGCNLRCPSFGINPTVSHNTEIEEIIKDIGKYEDLEQLPIVKTGCDTYYSVYPQFSCYSTWYDIDKLYNVLFSMLSSYHRPVDLVFTGGEPLLPKWQKFWVEFFKNKKVWELICTKIRNITFETNATQILSKDFKKIAADNIFNYSMSVKLPNSGHNITTTFNPVVIHEYISNPDNCWFKFVVENENDVLLIKELIESAYKKGDEIIHLNNVDVYLMPCGGEKELLDINSKPVYDLSIKYGYIFSPRLQVSIAGNGIGV